MRSILNSIRATQRVLSPDDRIAEALFGLIMVITFTGSLSIADAGRDDVRAMLIGALGCNLAWGLIDAVMYLMGCMAENGRRFRALLAVRRAPDERAGERAVADALPPLVASVLTDAELGAIRKKLLDLPEPARAPKLGKDDYLGAAGVFLLVFAATFPVTIPFILMHNVEPAMRVSNAVANVMLFVLGYCFGRVSGRNPWLYAVSMVVLGGALVGLTIALGG